MNSGWGSHNDEEDRKAKTLKKVDFPLPLMPYLLKFKVLTSL